MSIPIIITKCADVEDRIGYFDPRLEEMRNNSGHEELLRDKDNPGDKPFDIGAYRKIMLANIDDYLEKDKADNTASYNELLARNQRGEKERRGDILSSAAIAGTVLGLTGSIYGGAAGGIVGNLLKVHPSFRGIHAGGKGAAIGAALGGVGLGSMGFWGMKPFRKRQPIAHPGELSEYLKDYQDYEAMGIRDSFANPITGKDKLNDNVRVWALGDIPEDRVTYEKTAGVPVPGEKNNLQGHMPPSPAKKKWGMSDRGSSFGRDFLAGVEPTGSITFDSALHNKDRHNMHKAINVAGGFVGGAAIIPGILSGMALGVPRYLAAGKGRKLSVITSAIAKPYRLLGEGYMAKRELKNIVSGKSDSTKHIERLLGETNLNELRSLGKDAFNGRSRRRAGSFMGGIFHGQAGDTPLMSEKARKAIPNILRNNPEASKRLDKTIGTGLVSGAGLIGLSGATNALSAAAQYNSGLTAQRMINEGKIT